MANGSRTEHIKVSMVELMEVGLKIWMRKEDTDGECGDKNLYAGNSIIF